MKLIEKYGVGNIPKNALEKCKYFYVWKVPMTREERKLQAFTKTTKHINMCDFKKERILDIKECDKCKDYKGGHC